MCKSLFKEYKRITRLYLVSILEALKKCSNLLGDEFDLSDKELIEKITEQLNITIASLHSALKSSEFETIANKDPLISLMCDQVLMQIFVLQDNAQNDDVDTLVNSSELEDKAIMLALGGFQAAKFTTYLFNYANLIEAFSYFFIASGLKNNSLTAEEHQELKKILDKTKGEDLNFEQIQTDNIGKVTFSKEIGLKDHKDEN